MARYTLKIKFGDVEMDFESQEPASVESQMDGCLEEMLGVKLEAVKNQAHQEVSAPEPLIEPREVEKIFSESKEVEKETILSIPLGGESFSEILTRTRNIDEELPLTLFMQRKVSASLFDDFIITAFFLKNVLNQESFTIKSLNLNLYSAANKLVDFEILNEALRGGYVKTVEAQGPDEPAKYTITPSGEGYYNKLQDA